MPKENVSSHTKTTNSGKKVYVNDYSRNSNKSNSSSAVQPPEKENLVQLTKEELKESALTLLGQTRRQMSSHRHSPKSVIVSLKRAVDTLLEAADPSIETKNNAPLVNGTIEEITPPIENYPDWHQAGFSQESEWYTWKTFGFGAEAAHNWEKLGVPIAEAIKWKSVGPDEYHEWRQSELLPSVASNWKQAGITAEEAKICTQEKVNINDAQFFKKLGPLEEIQKIRSQHPITRKETEKWLERGIQIQDIGKWIEKGYTPAKAEATIKRGKTVEIAKDLRSKAPLPGTSWKKINDAAQKHGWKMSPPEKIHTDYEGASKFVCQITKNDYVRYAHFNHKGRFLKLTISKNVWSHGSRKLQDAIDVIEN